MIKKHRDYEHLLLFQNPSLIPYHTIQPLMTLRKEAWENIEGKGENAAKQHFLLFPLCFLFIKKPHFNF